MKEGERMEHTFEKRKKVIYDLICDDLYVPMKLKDIRLFQAQAWIETESCV